MTDLANGVTVSNIAYCRENKNSGYDSEAMNHYIIEKESLFNRDMTRHVVI